MRNTISIMLAIVVALSTTPLQAKHSDCPSKAQKILVIDLKSGWWQGDGGDTHEIITKHLSDHCGNVKLEYRHSTYGGGGYGSGGGFGFGGFGNKELNEM